MDELICPCTSALVRPGDVLVIGTKRAITALEADAIRNGLLEMLPQLADVVIMSQATVEAVYREEDS